MKRWRAAGSLAAVALAGFVPSSVRGESVPPGNAAAPAPVREGDVVVFRTAGQPERRVKVLRISRYDDGAALADVQDQVSGTKYALPVQALALAARSQTAPPAWAPPTPTYAPAPAPLTASPAAQASRAKPPKTAAPAPTPDAAKPTFLAKVFGRKETPRPVPAPKVLAPSAVAAMAAPKPIPLEVPASSSFPPHADTVAEVQNPPTALPPLAESLPPVPIGPVVPVVAVTLPVPVTPAAVADAPVLVPVVPVTPEAAEPVPAPPVIQPPAPVVTLPESTWRAKAPVQLIAARPAAEPEHVDPGIVIQSWQTRGRDILLADDVAPLVTELQHALRPSIREMAATALVEGRYASLPAIKGAIAAVAMADPAPSVRAHCIRCLSDLGYHESTYVNYLKTCEFNEVPELRASARAALAKLHPRN